MEKLRNLTTLKDISIETIMQILNRAESFAKGEKPTFLKDKVVANLFFEPSTRTQYSFLMAQHKLGIKQLDFSPETSSLLKGETFYDTVKTFESMGVDAFVIRHSQNNYFDELKNIKTPIINAGDGTGNHPTQSLLDLLTIYQEFGTFENIKIAIIGDIFHSRVAHTNIEIMQRLGMKTYIVAPDEFKEENYEFIELDEILSDLDVIMLLRVQNERHTNKLNLTNEEYNKRYGMNMEKVNKTKENTIIMHPAPFNRGVEISDDVVECSKSRIFKQVENGVYIRMAILEMILSE